MCEWEGNNQALFSHGIYTNNKDIAILVARNIYLKFFPWNVCKWHHSTLQPSCQCGHVCTQNDVYK
jgi:hypothetical protein